MLWLSTITPLTKNPVWNPALGPHKNGGQKNCALPFQHDILMLGTVFLFLARYGVTNGWTLLKQLVTPETLPLDQDTLSVSGIIWWVSTHLTLSSAWTISPCLHKLMHSWKQKRQGHTKGFGHTYLTHPLVQARMILMRYGGESSDKLNDLEMGGSYYFRKILRGGYWWFLWSCTWTV